MQVEKSEEGISSINEKDLSFKRAKEGRQRRRAREKKTHDDDFIIVIIVVDI